MFGTVCLGAVGAIPVAQFQRVTAIQAFGPAVLQSVSAPVFYRRGLHIRREELIADGAGIDRANPDNTVVNILKIPVIHQNRVGVFRKVEIPYEPNEDGTEQIVKVYIQDQDQSMAKPAEEFVLTEATTVDIQLDIQEGQIAAFRIDKDGTVIAEESIAYEDLN